MSNINWFNEARYGMFIHWGAYSVAARGEWVLNRETIPYDEYTAKYVDNFIAEKYDPREWARLAKKAGMKYMVLTTRHHDGFALWDTKTNDYNAVKMGPKKDLVRLFADAVREEGLKLGFYFSCADWRHPDYPGAYHRDWPTKWKDETSRARFQQYYNQQLEELMTNYGKIDMLWYDGCIPDMGDGHIINARIKELQPHILINDRNGKPYDFVTPEQKIEKAEENMPWESCITLNGHWGYHAGDHNYKTAKDIIYRLTVIAAGGGNLLLNVGPRADGTIPEEAAKILLEAGEWLGRNGEFLPDSSFVPFSWFDFGRITTKGNRVYLHIFNYPGRGLCFAELENKVLSARYLASGKEIQFIRESNRIFLKELDFPAEEKIATTIVLEIEGEIKPAIPLETVWIPL